MLGGITRLRAEENSFKPLTELQGSWITSVPVALLAHIPETEHPAEFFPTLASFSQYFYSPPHQFFSKKKKNAEVNDDAIKALITWWQQIDFKTDYINSWATGEADIMEIKPLNIFKIP